MYKTTNKHFINLPNGKRIERQLFVEVTNVNHILKSKMILAYVKKGYIEERIESEIVTDESGNPVLDADGNVQYENVTYYDRIATDHYPQRYHEDEMKALLDANNYIVNSSQSNLMTTESSEGCYIVLEYLITTDSTGFFGVDFANWTRE